MSCETPTGRKEPLEERRLRVFNKQGAGGFLLLCAIHPSYCNVFQDDHNGEWQCGRVIIKHGDEIISRTLNKDQAQQEGKDATADYNC